MSGFGAGESIVTLEHGLVPQRTEMSKTWPAAALQAQAIAARSYAGYRLRPDTDSYDTVDDTRSQVYRGYLAERGATNAAIAATAGIVLRSGTSIVNAVFHSTGGGATEHNENAFVSATGAKVACPVSYLRGSADCPVAEVGVRSPRSTSPESASHPARTLPVRGPG